MTAMLLGWNEGLTEEGDHDGCTPLHFAASQQPEQGRTLLCRIITQHSNKFPWIRFTTTTSTAATADIPLLLLQANPCSAYCRDAGGAFPIHVAAAVGAHKAVSTLLGMFPDSAGLHDADGRTFLHVAVEKKRLHVVQFACHCARSFKPVLNMQDKDGNTALHMAVAEGELDIFRCLIRNSDVNINLQNNEGHTPMDIALGKVHSGFYFGLVN